MQSNSLKPALRVTLVALLAGILLAVVIAGTVTLIEWYSNPGGIFRSAEGTRWHFVRETFASWFWPLALLSLPVASVCYIAVRRGTR